jgi:hypothetical protein
VPVTPDPAAGEPVEVTLFERAGCHLCEVAATALLALGRRRRFRLVRVDIESDPALEERYGFEIPVIAVAGEVVTRAPVDLGAVHAAIERADRGDRRDRSGDQRQ